MHDVVVSLDGTFEYLENTYGKTPEAVDGLRQMKENTFRLEQKLFLHFDFEPHELPNML
jgi:hypothetical protein